MLKRENIKKERNGQEKMEKGRDEEKNIRKLGRDEKRKIKRKKEIEKERDKERKKQRMKEIKRGRD